MSLSKLLVAERARSRHGAPPGAPVRPRYITGAQAGFARRNPGDGNPDYDALRSLVRICAAGSGRRRLRPGRWLAATEWRGFAVDGVKDTGDLTSGERRSVRSPWPVRGGAPARPSSYQYLLDIDVDLADELDVRMRMAARSAVTAMTFDADVGEVRLSDWLVLAASGPGVLVLDGVLAVNVRVGDRIAAELIGTGDLIQPLSTPAEELLACDTSWRALVPTRFALLDGDFAQRVHPWPQITDTLLRRGGRRNCRLGAQRAISAQPRLEVRLALLLWHLAARWGKVEPGGIRLPIPLTHQLLGRLIGAERPSVSHALSRLANAGLVSGHGDEWHLHGSVDEQLGSMVEPSAERVAQLGTAASRLRPG